MRLLFPVLTLPLLVPAATVAQTTAAPAIQSPENAVRALAATKSTCRKTTSHHAEQSSAWPGDPVAPRKLTDLPPAESYMAVYRTVSGCEEPMTVAEYQRGVMR
jgi:hypothetical protein